MYALCGMSYNIVSTRNVIFDVLIWVSAFERILLTFCLKVTVNTKKALYAVHILSSGIT